MGHTEKEKKQMRELMRKKNATKEGAECNRKRVKNWRKDKPKQGTRKIGRNQDYREAILYYLIDRDGWNCFYCGKPLELNDVHISHILARAFGGKCRLENYTLAHPLCNAKDGIEVHKKIICKK